MSIALQHQAQKLASILPPLLLEAERVASSLQQGIHGRRRAGMGESFWQFRRYAPGDAATRIDWRQSARTDKLFIREREWEAAQNVYLWADSSGSMRYGSNKNLPTKTERAHVLMLALASLLLSGGEQVTWLSAEPTVARGKTGLKRIAAHIDLNRAENGTSAPPQIRIARHAHMILCSDFLTPADELEKFMRHYAALNLRGALLHILDPAETDLPFEGRLELQGCESEVSLLLPNARALRDQYRQRMEEHKQRLKRYAESAGWFYLPHVTSESPHSKLLQLYQYLSADLRGL
jgi:uncharacterized protein (DUF58 family)